MKQASLTKYRNFKRCLKLHNVLLIRERWLQIVASYARQKRIGTLAELNDKTIENL